MNFSKVIEISYALAGKHRSTHRCRHFSFIYDRNSLISVGMNNPKTHPLNLKYNYINKQKDRISDIVGTHSELNAVIKLGYESCDGLTIINTRINRLNEIDYSKPCHGCMDMLTKLGFKKIIYTTKDKKFSEVVISKPVLVL